MGDSETIPQKRPFEETEDYKEALVVYQAHIDMLLQVRNYLELAAQKAAREHRPTGDMWRDIQEMILAGYTWRCGEAARMFQSKVDSLRQRYDRGEL